MKRELINKIADRHLMEIDKYYRIFSGLSSDLDDYSDDTIYLTVKRNSKWAKGNETTARQIARNWRKVNPELRNAKKFHVTIIKRNLNGSNWFNMEEIHDPIKIKLKTDVFKSYYFQQSSIKEERIVIADYFDDYKKILEDFGKLNDAEKLILYLKMISNQQVTVYDELLHKWWVRQ